MLRQILALVLTAFLSLGMVSAAQATQVEITVSKVGQKMTVRVDGRVEYVWPVSTGARGYTTPSGSFKPFRLEEDHFSKEWDDAPMPHAIFFTPRGHAIHGSFSVKSLGRPVSHGCVRLHPDNAAVLFDLVQEAGLGNTRVIVKGGFFDFGYAPKRSFADVGDDMEKTINTKKRKAFSWFGAKAKPKKVVKAKAKAKSDGKAVAAKKGDPKAKQTAAAKKADGKAKKVAAAKKADPKAKTAAGKCVTKDGKKQCEPVKTASN